MGCGGGGRGGGGGCGGCNCSSSGCCTGVVAVGSQWKPSNKQISCIDYELKYITD